MISDNEAWLRFCHDVGDALYEGDEPEDDDDDGFRDGGIDKEDETCDSEDVGEDGIE